MPSVAHNPKVTKNTAHNTRRPKPHGKLKNLPNGELIPIQNTSKWWLMSCILALIFAGLGFLLVSRQEGVNETNFIIPLPFEIAAIPGKGMGVVATREIEPGQLLFREEPLFTVPSSTHASPEDLITSRIQTLTPAQRSMFLNLSYVIPGVDISTVRLTERTFSLAIFQTNAIAAGSDVGIFPKVARLNHGCSAAFNAVYSWRDKAGQLVVHAIKHIHAGEEILTTYTDTKRRRAERRAYLKENYDFDCSCAVCSLPDSQSRKSDLRLEKMKELYHNLATWSSGSIDGREAVDIAREIWSLGEEEGYYSERGQLAADVVHVAAAHSDFHAASSWAKLSVEWFMKELGADSDQAQGMVQYVTDPTSHPAWASHQIMAVE